MKIETIIINNNIFARHGRGEKRGGDQEDETQQPTQTKSKWTTYQHRLNKSIQAPSQKNY